MPGDRSLDQPAPARRRIAVVLFNLGGPDGPRAVRPFLRNLFSDPAILNLPALIRKPLAALIAWLRARSAIANYGRMGGASPILPGTKAQAEALEVALERRLSGGEIKVFIAMRHWTPLTAAVARDVAAFEPDDVVLVPLYPQFSTTTTGSSLTAWRAAYRGVGVSRAICCWYAEPGFITAHVQRILETWRAAGTPKVRLLFSAHGLPERTIAAGDPYQWQIEQTCAAIVAGLDGDWDWKICYQSRVGPLKWLGPSTPDALREAAREGLDVLIDPVAFVSEHIETLVELDLDYAELAHRIGIKTYLRAAAVGEASEFIEGLAKAVERSLHRGGCAPDGVACPIGFSGCGRADLSQDDHHVH